MYVDVRDLSEWEEGAIEMSVCMHTLLQELLVDGFQPMESRSLDSMGCSNS